MQKIRDAAAWLRTNWKFVTQIAAIIGAAIGANAAMQPAAQPERPPDIWIVSDGLAMGVEEARPVRPGDVRAPLKAGGVAQADPVEAGEWVLVARIALQVAVKILERRAPNTPGDLDDRLLALLKLFAADRSAFEAAEAAAGSRPAPR